MGLFESIDSDAERLRVWRPSCWAFGFRPKPEERERFRKRVTGAALKRAVEADFNQRDVTAEDLREAIDADLNGTHVDKATGFWLELLIPLVIRAVLLWLERRKELRERQEPAGQE